MNSKSLRRLAGDHGSLHTAGLPPNYLFPPSSDASADLTSLDVLLAGPVGTPYAGGVWRLHLDIPPNYPTAPPTAQFRTRLWHPNIDETTGAVCVETLKRDWSSSLKLRDVLVTISCLLIQPNPASALNEAAGKLATEDWNTYCRRAKLMTEIHAPVPVNIADQVREAQMRGEELPISKPKRNGEELEQAGLLHSSSKLQKATDEDEENSRRRGNTDKTESDPEGDWIPEPDNASKAPVTSGVNNVFGLKGIDDTMHLGRRSAKRIYTSVDSAAGQGGHINTHDTERFTIVSSKRGVQQSDSVNFSIPETREHLRFSHQNPFSALQPSSQTHPLIREFSYSWPDIMVTSDTDGIDGVASKGQARKRLACDDLETKRGWEMKRFQKTGYNLGRYNRGEFGPRTGINRL